MATRNQTQKLPFSIELFNGTRYQYKSRQYVFTQRQTERKSKLFSTHDVQELLTHIDKYKTKQYNGKATLQSVFSKKKISLVKNLREQHNFYNKTFSKDILSGVDKFWDGLNTFYQIKKQRKIAKSRNKWCNCSNILDKAYDVLICTFSIVDMIFDIIVTRHFYANNHQIFFYCSVTILLIAQIAYAAFMAIGLEPIVPAHMTRWKEKVRYRQWRQYLAFIIVFPFGQLVPLLLMAQNSSKSMQKRFEQIYLKFGFENHMDLDMERALFQMYDGSDNDGKDSKDKDSDPLSLYIRQKFMSHLGFLIEAITESVPQSILQMVFLIMYPPDLSHTHSWINIVSIIMSMVVVISKGAMISYSFYRKTSIFNFLCFAMDVFGFFTVFSWLFCSSVLSEMESEACMINLYGLYQFKIWIPSHFYFHIMYYVLRLLMILIPAWIGFLIHIHYHCNCHQPWRELDFFLLSIVCWTAGALPIAVVVLMIRFTLIPLFVMRSYDHSNNKLFSFYNIIYPFLTSSNSFQEIHEKLLLANWITLEKTAYQKPQRRWWFSMDDQPSIRDRLKEEYQGKGTLSLSYFYEVNDRDILAKYHKILQILSILVSRSTFWKFILYKVISSVYGNCDDRNWKALEHEFWTIMISIRDIIGFDKEQVGSDIQNWFDCVVKEQINDFLEYVSNIFWYALCQISCIRHFLTWFFTGLYDALYQDISMLSRKNRRISPWNLPQCWRNFIFTSEDSQDDIEYEYIYDSNDWPWIGRGLFVFVVVVIFKCIHIPFHTLVTSKVWEKSCVCVMITCLVLGCVLLIVLALYSLFLPFYFVIHIGNSVGIVYLIKHNTLQSTLTFLYFVIFAVISIMVPSVWKFIYCNLHLCVDDYFDNKQRKGERKQIANFVIQVYETSKCRDCMIEKNFGADVSGIILSYLGKWNFNPNRVIFRKYKT